MHRYVILALILAQAAFGYMVIQTPESLGVPPIVMAWLAVLNVLAGAGLNQLNRVQE